MVCGLWQDKNKSLKTNLPPRCSCCATFSVERNSGASQGETVKRVSLWFFLLSAVSASAIRDKVKMGSTNVNRPKKGKNYAGSCRNLPASRWQPTDRSHARIAGKGVKSSALPQSSFIPLFCSKYTLTILFVYFPASPQSDSVTPRAPIEHLCVPGAVLTLEVR